jgi:hypothetical protein
VGVKRGPAVGAQLGAVGSLSSAAKREEKTQREEGGVLGVINLA